MPLTPGTRIGPYEVTGSLGAGGMGVVYRAIDTNRRRDVAIKVVPEEVAQDAERLARFEREARTLAALNHPNIAQIYGLERSRSGGSSDPPTTALVMELVEGPTLADRIGLGAIPIDEALPIAKQIAEALEAAHEQGIIHRDLKPANVQVRPDGTVKVLDFGLAKAMEPASALGASAGHARSMSPTVTTPAMTQAGMILGTAAYMSPEQARGQVVDRRTDVFAFACVLYECLTGRKAFGGETIAETLGAVLEHPDWTLLPSNTPPSVRSVLERCFRKAARISQPGPDARQYDRGFCGGNWRGGWQYLPPVGGGHGVSPPADLEGRSRHLSLLAMSHSSSRSLQESTGSPRFVMPKPALTWS